MRRDIDIWLMFLENFNGVILYRLVNWLNDFDFQLYIDSVGNVDLGCGVVFGYYWVYLGWLDYWKVLDIFLDIIFLELVFIIMVFVIWGSNLFGKWLIIYIDNEVLVLIFNCNILKFKRVMYLFR